MGTHYREALPRRRGGPLPVCDHSSATGNGATTRWFASAATLSESSRPSSTRRRLTGAHGSIRQGRRSCVWSTTESGSNPIHSPSGNCCCTLLDCDHAGLLLKDVTESRVSDCLISNELPDAESWVPLKVIGGGENTIVDNRLDDE